MKIGPMFKWFGSKWQSAKRYPPPEHDRIIEPYAGGAGFSLNYCDRKVTIWDDDPLVTELWRWLITEATSHDVLDIPVGLAPGTVISEIGMSRGQALLLKHWQRTNNVGNCWTVSSWGHLPGQWTHHTRARLAEEIYAIKHWRLVNLTAFQWKFQDPASWFVDPPYLYNYRYSKSLPAFDHLELARQVASIRRESLVIVCEALDKKTRAIPDYLPFEASHRSVTSRRKSSQSHHSSEALYVRRPENSF